MAASSSTSIVEAPQPDPRWLGLVPSSLEEQYVETARIRVDDFGGRHGRRTRYEPAAGDDGLLGASGPLDFGELRQQRGQGAGASRSGHPLRSLRPPPDDEGKQHAKRHKRWGRVHAQGRIETLRSDMTTATAVAAAGSDSSGTGVVAVPALAFAAPVAEGTVLLRVAYFRQHLKVRELELHADQTLSELAAALGGCLTGVQLARQHRELAKQRGAAAAAARPLPTDGAAFCIEGCWYASGAADLSAHVRPWLEVRGKPSPPPKPMGSTRLGELTIRLGRQYLFVHHGDCEHALVFLSCWLAGVPTAAAPPLSAYPRTTFRRQQPSKQCVVCVRAPAKWEVHGDPLADANPCYLCQMCHFQAHYTAEGRSRHTDYRIYPIVREEDPGIEGAQQEAAAAAAAAAAPAGGNRPALALDIAGAQHVDSNRQKGCEARSKT